MNKPDDKLMLSFDTTVHNFELIDESKIDVAVCENAASSCEAKMALEQTLSFSEDEEKELLDKNLKDRKHDIALYEILIDRAKIKLQDAIQEAHAVYDENKKKYESVIEEYKQFIKKYGNK